MTLPKPPELLVGAGRPSLYKREYCEQVYKLSLLGAKDKEVADFFEISESTLNLWKLEHPEFSESMQDGKTKADTEVAAKLYGRAIGAEWIEEQAFRVKTGQHTEKVEIVQVRRAAPPETAAITRWLTNRQRDKWAERTEVNTNHTFAQMPTIKVGGSAIEFQVGEPPAKGDSNG